MAVVERASVGAEGGERWVFVVFPVRAPIATLTTNKLMFPRPQSILPSLTDLQAVWKDAQRLLATK